MTIKKTKEVDSTVDSSRRQAIGVLGAISALGATSLIGCGGGGGSNGASSSSSSSLSSSSLSSSSLGSSSSVATSVASSSATSSAASSAAGSCTLIPSETLGPYPLATILNSSSILRAAINEDKTGVPLTLKLKLVNVNNSCTPVSGYVYIWHCDKDGLYSGYDTSNNAGQTGETYCRGVQYTDSSGQATFTTIYPGWYAGRITHVHFQIFLTSYSSTASSTAVSQLGFPTAITTAVYNSSLYTAKGQNTSVTSFSADNVFSDGVTYQLATVTGNVTDGYVAELQVGIAV